MACSTGSAPAVRVDPPGGTACARLQDALPEELDGRPRRATVPASERTAAWGEPPVVLRCGGAAPAGLTPTSEVTEVEGVSWFLAESPAEFLLTAVGRRAYVQVRVPAGTPRDQVLNPLVDLAPAIKATIPAR